MRTIWLAGLIAVAVLVTARANAETIYESHHGIWSVICTQDLITNRRDCGVAATTAGEGILGESSLSMVVVTSPERRVLFRIPLLPWQTGFTMRTDSDAPQDFKCESINGTDCILGGAEGVLLLALWRNKSKLAVRLYDFNKSSHDFVFQLSGLGDALDDLKAQREKLL